MDKNTAPFETLKQILRHVRNPDLLNDHPWTGSLIVQEVLTSTPQLAQASPGQQLVSAIATLFPQLQPAQPPRCGKRLDPRWGEFGLLAALYFTPFNHGTSFPTSHLEAWGKIDPAILYHVYGKAPELLADEQVNRYELVGADLEYGSASTLSDWHKKGLQRFTEIILNRERFLSRTSNQPSILLNPEQAGSSQAPEVQARSRLSSIKRPFWLAMALLLVFAIGLGSLKAWKIYNSGMLVYLDVTGLQELVRGPVEIDTLDKAVPVLKTLQDDLSAFKEEARPVLWLSRSLNWIPVYGYDLASGPALIELAEHLLNASIHASQAAGPLLDEFTSQDSALDPAGLTALLVEAQPELATARQELDQALALRKTIAAEHLSPRLRGPLTEELNPLLKLADEGLSLAGALPGILGAGSEGPKTYMLLPQNEDELRPTGGFITSVGNLVLHNGQIISLDFESVDYEQEDWSKPYPSAPWQLQQYMNSRVLILRDANWFTDFPTTALWVEYLYAYTHSHSVDGIIAFDQHFLVMLLGELGPLDVEGAPYPITDQNVIEYMRQSKIPPEGGVAAEWDRKEFISKIAAAALGELTGGHSHDWRGIAGVLSQALAERHLLLQFDDPAVAALTVERGWDNAVRPQEGDFLMVTDTNIGFNKTSAVVDVSLSYDIDLNDVSAPQGTLTLTHNNNASRDVPCVHWNTGQITGEEWYPINRCYWSYLRIYKQAGVELLDATPHAIPGDWMLLGQGVPARVDELDEELRNAQGFGTLLVVPGGGSLSTSFKFALPRTVLSAPDASGGLTYHLKVQKQPGTVAIPVAIRIHLPNHASLKSTSTDAIMQENSLLIKTDLRTDIDLEVVFSLP